MMLSACRPGSATPEMVSPTDSTEVDYSDNQENRAEQHEQDDIPFIGDEQSGSDDNENTIMAGTTDKMAISRNTWVPAYMDELYNLSERSGVCALIYLNDDEIPEIVYFSGAGTAGSDIYSFQMDALDGRVCNTPEIDLRGHFILYSVLLYLMNYTHSQNRD